MYWLRALCCGRPEKEVEEERAWVGDVLNSVRLNSCNSWHVAAVHAVEALRVAMGSSSHVSILGASACGGSLLVLAAAGPSACGPLLSVGQQLPAPWTVPLPLPTRPEFPGTHSPRPALQWALCSRPEGARKVPGRTGGAAWSAICARVQSGLAASGGGGGGGTLLLAPLELGSHLVGALLCLQTADEAPRPPPVPPPPPPPPVISTVSVGSAVPQLGPVAEPHVRAHVSTAAAAVAAAAVTAAAEDGGGGDAVRLHSSRVALRAVAGVLVDCLFAPHLKSLQQVCTAAHHLAHAGDICSLAAVLSGAVAEALRTELHLDLQVRVAVATPAAAATTAGGGGGGAGPLHYGFLLQLRPPSTLSQIQTPHSTWQLQSVEALQLQHAAAAAGPPPVLPARLALSGTDGRVSRCNSQTRQIRLPPQQQLASDGRGGMEVPSRSESFLFVTTTDTVRLEGGTSVAPDGGGAAAAALPGGGLGRAAADYPRDRRAWKATPFALQMSLLGEILRDDTHTRAAVSTFPTASSGTPALNGPLYGSCKGNTTAAGTKSGLLPAVAMYRSNGSTGAPPSAAQAALPGRVRLACTILQDLHLYLQEVDQPGSDVFLMFGNCRRGSAAGASPACLVLLASSGGPADGPGGGGGGAAAAAAVNSLSAACLRHGLSGDIGPLKSTPEDVYDDVYSDMDGACALGPAAGRGGGGGAATVRPHLAVFLTSQDRLPVTLLRAARDVGQRMMEFLLPAALDSLACGPSGLELAEMNMLVEARAVQAGSFSNWGLSGRKDSGPFCAASPPVSANSGIHRLVTKHRIPSNGSSTTAISAPATPIDVAAAAAAAADDGAAARGAAAAAAAAAVSLSVGAPGRALLPSGGTTPAAAAGLAAASPAPAPAPLLPRQPLRKFSSRSSMLGRTQTRTTASVGDGRDSPQSSGTVRRMAAELVASILSPFNTPASMSPSATASFVAIPRQGSLTASGAGGFGGGGGGDGGGVELSFGGVGGAALGGALDGNGSVGGASSVAGSGLSMTATSMPHQLRARLAGVASQSGPPAAPRAPRRSVTELLDLDGLGTDSRAAAEMMPNMETLLQSMYSTLNDADADPSPYAADDLRFLRLTRVIGNGGCSTVYAGRLLGLEVAVKVLEPLPDGAVEALQAAAEARAAAAEAAAAGEAGHGGPGGGGTGGNSPDHLGEGDGEGDGEVRHHQSQPQRRLQARWAVARNVRLKDLMRGARELAVLSSISHPNIVQVYSYHTNVMVVPGPHRNDLPKLLPVGPQKPPQPQQQQQQQQQLQQQQQPPQQPAAPGGPMHVAIVMECCDMGSLADALDSGRFKDAIIRAAAAARSAGPTSGIRRTASTLDRTRVNLAAAASADRSLTSSSRVGSITSQSSGGGGVAMRAIYLTLLEVALALRHLHSRSLVHCDVKAANVLLKSSTSDPRGFTCKLGDFGLVGIVRRDPGAGEGVPPTPTPTPNQDGAVGTVTHLAPEYFSPGTRLDFSMDMYAFGVVMWEVFTSKPPYMEHASRGFKDLPHFVLNEGLRPRWPAHVPVPYRSLACACWAADPLERPTSAAVVTMLQRLMES